MNQQELAQWLRIHIGSLRRRMYRGDLQDIPCIKEKTKRKRYKFDKEEVYAYFKKKFG